MPSPDDSAHHAEKARVIIQSELEGNDCMNAERQSILKSALGFVNTLANGRTSLPDDEPSFDIPDEDCEESPQSLAPTPEMLYMILRGKGFQSTFLMDTDTNRTKNHQWCFFKHTVARSYLGKNTSKDGLGVFQRQSPGLALLPILRLRLCQGFEPHVSNAESATRSAHCQSDFELKTII